MDSLAARRIGAYAVAGVLLILLIQRFLLVELFVRRCGLPIVAACVVAVAMIGCGSLLGRTHDPATALLVGYPIFGTFCFLIGLLRVNRVTMAVVTIALILLNAARPRTLRAPAESGSRHIHVALVILALLACVSAQAPAIQLDEVAYHLSVPWEWVKEGRAVALPLISHSYFPLGTESADVPLLAFLGPMQGG